MKGAHISTPGGSGTRPTADRVREAVFSILGDVEGLSVLDMFAGSGGLALEALSRGAASAVMVDSSPAALKAMRKNVEKLRVEQAEITRSNYLVYLKGAAARGRRFDLIFIDPPYRMHRVIQRELAKWLPEVAGAKGRIIVESSSRDDLTGELGLPFELIVHKVYGDTAVSIYHMKSGHYSQHSNEQ